MKIRTFKQTLCLCGVVALASFAVTLPTLATAEENQLVQSDHDAQGQGTIDWAGNYIEVSAQGTSRFMGNKIKEELMAKQAARTMAQAKLLETVKGIRLTGISTLGELSQNDTKVATRIKGVLKGVETISETATWSTDKSSPRGEVVMAEVTLRLCLSKDCLASDLEASAAPAANQPPSSSEVYSGVIIDLEKALFLPVLEPEIIDSNGQSVFSSASLSPEAKGDKAVARYSKTLAEAQTLARIGSNPLTVKAQGISEDNKIIVSLEDGAKIKQVAALTHAALAIALD